MVLLSKRPKAGCIDKKSAGHPYSSDLRLGALSGQQSSQGNSRSPARLLRSCHLLRDR